MECYKLSRSQSRCWWYVWSRVRSLLERTHRSWFGTWPTFLASAEGRTTTGPLVFGAWQEKYTFWTALHKYNIGSTTTATHKKSESTYSKSVAAFSSVTGVNEMTFLLRPRTHAVSGELANTWPGRGTRKCWCQSAAARGWVFRQPHICAKPYHLWNFQSFSRRATGWPSRPTWCRSFCRREKAPLPGAKRQ